jgi:hypothetical protein
MEWRPALITLRHILFLAGGLYCAGEAPARSRGQSCEDIKGSPSNLLVQSTALKYTVTNFDPSWFDTDNPEKSPTLFMLTIRPAATPDNDSLPGRLRLRVLILADTTLGRKSRGEAPWVLAMDRLSIPLTAAEIGKPLRSNDVFGFDWETGGIPFDQSDLFNIVTEKRQAPEMNLHFTFGLTCDGGQVGQGTATIGIDSLGGSIGRLRYIKTIQALSPGTQVTSPKPVPIYTLTPIFKVVSELFNNKEFVYPPGEPKMEVFIYELMAGESPKDALDGLEFAKFGMIDESPMAYPAHLPRLQAGKTYVWRARAILRGPTSDYLFSNPLYFKLDERLEGGISFPNPELTDIRTLENQIKYGDDYTKRVMAALKIIMGDNFEIFDLSRAGKIPAKGQIRLNGHPYSLEELERLAREFHQSKHGVTRLRFQ